MEIILKTRFLVAKLTLQSKKVVPKETPTNSTSSDRAKRTQFSPTIDSFWLVPAREMQARKADTQVAQIDAQIVTLNLLKFDSNR